MNEQISKWQVKNADKPASQMTKREMIAAMAMQGLLACGDSHDEHTTTVTAKSAVSLADALLAELEKVNDNTI
jgi:hypothetical protein